MNKAGIYKIKSLEFDTQSGRLWLSGNPDNARCLHDNEARLLEVLIEDFHKTPGKKGYNDTVITRVWRGELPKDGSLAKSIQFLREEIDELGESGEEYIQSWPYKLRHKPEPIRKTLSESSSLDQCEGCDQELGVIADLRLDRCLIALGLRNLAWLHRRFSATMSRQDPERILTRYFFPLAEDSRNPNQRVAIMSGIDYPEDRTFSESGSLVASHYIDAFGTNRIERVEKLEDIKRDDALVLLASHQGHPKSRQYVGDPKAHSPAHRVKISAARNLGYEAELPWAIYTPEDARKIHILQTHDGERMTHKTKEHIISSLDGPALRSKAGKDGAHDVWLSDYLLITALPTDSTEQRRVISFIGLHLTGTLAAAKLLREAPPEILDTIHRKLAGYRYFQALISLEVNNAQSNRGLARPGHLTGVKVEPVTIRKIGARR